MLSSLRDGVGVALLLRPAKKRTDMTTRRVLYLPAALLGTLAAAVVLACAAALLAGSQKAEATFPGKNGRIAYATYDGNDYEIYTINPNGSGKIKVTNNVTDD